MERPLLRNAFALTAITAGMLIQCCAVAGAQTYRNAEFGIDIPVPDQLPTCRGAPTEHNHGIRIFLDPNDTQRCAGPEQHRREMGIFAYFNAVEATQYLPDFLRWACEGTTEAPCRPAPPNLRFGPYRTMSGRVDRADGWSDIVVVTQGPVEPPDYPTGLVNYVVTLRTDRGHFPQDLRSFRRFLHSIRLTRPE